jgi:hypothetical protein
LFVYRVYEPCAGSGIDPVVVGVLIRRIGAASAESFNVSGDIAGESSGDQLFECPPRDAIGWTAMTEAARDIANALALQSIAVAAALENVSRRE